MEIFCPNCKSKAKELIECENCNKIGCIKCFLKVKGKWLCESCRKGEAKEASLFSMFS